MPCHANTCPAMQPVKEPCPQYLGAIWQQEQQEQPCFHVPSQGPAWLTRHGAHLQHVLALPVLLHLQHQLLTIHHLLVHLPIAVCRGTQNQANHRWHGKQGAVAPDQRCRCSERTSAGPGAKCMWRTVDAPVTPCCAMPHLLARWPLPGTRPAPTCPSAGAAQRASLESAGHPTTSSSSCTETAPSCRAAEQDTRAPRHGRSAQSR